jgi:hypothetical protein
MLSYHEMYGTWKALGETLAPAEVLKRNFWGTRRPPPPARGPVPRIQFGSQRAPRNQVFPYLSGEWPPRQRDGHPFQATTSTTSRADPSGLAAHLSTGQCVLARGQIARVVAAAVCHTSPTSTSHPLAPSLRRCRSLRIRAPQRPLRRPQSS